MIVKTAITSRYIKIGQLLHKKVPFVKYLFDTFSIKLNRKTIYNNPCDIQGLMLIVFAW